MFSAALFLAFFVLLVDATVDAADFVNRTTNSSLSNEPLEITRDADLEPVLDDGQKLIKMIKNKNPEFENALGFNLTGTEILCNCSSGSYCNSRRAIIIINRYQLMDVCIGQACFVDKRLGMTYDLERANQTRVGCYGNHAGTHSKPEEFECGDTEDFNRRCCRSSFCQKDIEDTFGLPEWASDKKIALLEKIQRWVIFGSILITTLILVVGGVCVRLRMRRYNIRLRILGHSVSPSPPEQGVLLQHFR